MSYKICAGRSDRKKKVPVPSTSPMQKTSVQYVSSRKKSGVAPLEEMYGVI